MSSKVDRLFSWKDDIYSATTITAGAGALRWLTASPYALVLGLVDTVMGRKPAEEPEIDESRKIEEVTGAQMKMMDQFFEQEIYDVSNDIQVIVRNLNPAVPLAHLRMEEIASMLRLQIAVIGSSPFPRQYNDCVEGAELADSFEPAEE